MQQGRTDISPHALTERERPHRNIEKGSEFQEIVELREVALETVRRDLVEMPVKLERFDDRQVPPQRGALTEDRIAGMGEARGAPTGFDRRLLNS